jgi:hypothetical protein
VNCRLAPIEGGCRVFRVRGLRPPYTYKGSAFDEKLLLHVELQANRDRLEGMGGCCFECRFLGNSNYFAT